jgi:hypothetical protein
VIAVAERLGVTHVATIDHRTSDPSGSVALHNRERLPPRERGQPLGRPFCPNGSVPPCRTPALTASCARTSR